MTKYSVWMTEKDKEDRLFGPGYICRAYDGEKAGVWSLDEGEGFYVLIQQNCCIGPPGPKYMLRSSRWSGALKGFIVGQIPDVVQAVKVLRWSKTGKSVLVRCIDG